MKQIMKTLPVLTALLTLALIGHGGGQALAADANPCADDFRKFCGDVTPGGGRLLACYEKQKDKLSPDCRAWAESAKSNAASLKSVCAREIDQACNAERGDPLALLNCLQKEYISLSPRCVEKLNEFKYHYPLPPNPH